MSSSTISQAGLCLMVLTIYCVTPAPWCAAKPAPSLFQGGGPARAAGGRQSQEVIKLSEAEIAKLLTQESGNQLVPGDRSGITPAYLWGDFNGDGAIDVAIVAALNPSVKFDPRAFSAFVTDKVYDPSDLKSHKFLLKTLGEYGNGPILVIFHGAGGAPDGFRIKERFVVLDGFDAPPLQMRIHRGKLYPAVAGDEPKVVPPPKLIGDGIVGIGEDDTGTAIFWYQGKYCWYPVEKYSKRKYR